MKRVAVVYWSGTGNTEQMANAVADGARKAGAEVTLLTPADFNSDKVSQFDALAFGCPAMGRLPAKPVANARLYASMHPNPTAMRMKRRSDSLFFPAVSCKHYPSQEFTTSTANSAARRASSSSGLPLCKPLNSPAQRNSFLDTVIPYFAHKPHSDL